jgi:predicted DNA-binding transcriptional regulator AlpA
MPEATLCRTPVGMDAHEAAGVPSSHRFSLAEPLLGADDVGRLLAVPRSSVYEYARRRHDPLPSIRIGRHVPFHPSDVEGWLDAQRVGDPGRRGTPSHGVPSLGRDLEAQPAVGM